ncbi:MAG: Smr/MutS family protein [Candidatus Methanoperedens sp.]|nr:Smr/MutS family protein [Candidatus Methanoperedens sp.]
MASFEVDIFEKCVVVDLHKYSHRTALIVVREKIKEAYGHGFRHIKLIHGAADVRKKNDGGSIKFTLHSILKRGELDKWVEKKECEFQEGELILRLKKNPVPVDGGWKEIPYEEY